MTPLDWVIVIGCWMLVPAVLGLKAVIDRRAAKARDELDKLIAEFLAAKPDRR